MYKADLDILTYFISLRNTLTLSMDSFPYLLACTVSANQTLPKVPVFKRVHTAQRLLLKAPDCHLIKHFHMDIDTMHKSFSASFSFFATQS